MAALTYGYDKPVVMTRYAGLGFTHSGPGLWRLVDISEGPTAHIGPHYRTKAELLADLDRYARDIWGTDPA